MAWKYYNANPEGRKVNDCTVRAISLATGRSWDDAYVMLSEYARAQRIMPDEVDYIDDFLRTHFEKICGCKYRQMTVRDFAREARKGTFLITMNGHITCCIDGCIYDTFDPGDRYIWDIYKVEQRGQE